MIEKDYYKILEIPYSASQAEIEAAYKKLSKKYHPDFFHNNSKQEYANELMKRINEAYSVLKDPKQKAIIDQKIRKKRTNTLINTLILIVSLIFITALGIYNYFNYQHTIKLGLEIDLIPVVILALVVIFTIAHLTGWILEVIKNRTKRW